MGSSAILRCGSVTVSSLSAPSGPTSSPARRRSAARTPSRFMSIWKEGRDTHCAQARAAGAVIVREPDDQFYGDRVYSAKDPEGHVWNFGQTVRVVSREEAEKASGLKIEGWA